MASRKTTANAPVPDNTTYDQYLDLMQQRFQTNLDKGPLFTTDASDLFAEYLLGFPMSERQYHTCSACRRFVTRYGGLVVIDDRGEAHPAMWHPEDAPADLVSSVSRVYRLVKNAKVTGVFLSKNQQLGNRVTGQWHHLSAHLLTSLQYESQIFTAGQAMAEKREEYATVLRALDRYTLPVLTQALAILKADVLYGTEKVLGQAEWLFSLHEARRKKRGAKAWHNLVWRAVATAPAGFCHPASSMIGTLLEDIASGMPFPTVAERFKAKMHPLLYQRPTAAPTAGNIAQAEKIVEKLGIAASLKRRYARVEEITALWRPKALTTVPPANSVFGHLRAKVTSGSLPPLTVETGRITWAKFSRDVLPFAERIDCMVPFGHKSFCALLTAVDPEAPPILQWDEPNRRNPFSMYLWSEGSPASQWMLTAGQWTPVTAITELPAQWHDPLAFGHQGSGVIFVLSGARETKLTGGLALFPSILRSELHAVRSTIEAYSKIGTLEGSAEASACGLLLSRKSTMDHAIQVRVESGTITSTYLIDRLE